MIDCRDLAEFWSMSGRRHRATPCRHSHPADYCNPDTDNVTTGLRLKFFR